MGYELTIYQLKQHLLVEMFLLLLLFLNLNTLLIIIF